MARHTILFLAVNPRNRNQALAEEAGALDNELRRTSGRECFVLETRWAPEPLELLRALRELKPTIVHFTGHGDRTGLLFPTANGDVRLVPNEAIAHAFEAAGTSVRLIVLSACDSTSLIEVVLPHVACIVSISSTIPAEAMRAFVTGFYGALGESESIRSAFLHGSAAVSLVGSLEPGAVRPRLWVHNGVDAASFVLVPGSESAAQPTREYQEQPRQLLQTAEKKEDAQPEKQVTAIRTRAKRRFSRYLTMMLVTACLVASLLALTPRDQSTQALEISLILKLHPTMGMH